MIRRAFIMASILLCFPFLAQATWFQYTTADGLITGGPAANASDFDVVYGHDVIEDPSNPDWPSPSGCTSGIQEWTQLSSGNVLPLIVRSDLVWFSSSSTLPLIVEAQHSPQGCAVVGSWSALREVVSNSIIAAVDVYPLTQALNHLSVVTFIAVCPTAGPTDCPAARTKMTALNNVPTIFPSPTALDAFLGNVQTLIDDAVALKGTACSAGHATFCS